MSHVTSGEDKNPKPKTIKASPALVSSLVEAFESVVNDAVLQAKPKSYTIHLNQAKIGEIMGTQHALFPKVLQIMSLGLNLWLTGPAGSGKTQMVERAADALKKRFFAQSVCAQTTVSQFLGYNDANGRYVRSLFREAYENGGVFLLDEIDAGNPNVLSVLNASISNGYCAFPDGMIKRHEDFILAASGNTWGTGASRQYVGRLEIDAATLDRFVFIEVGYDDELENRICGNPRWAKIVQYIRSRVIELGMRHVVSPRASIFGSLLLEAGVEPSDVLKMVVYKGMSDDDIKKIVGDSDKFSTLLKKVDIKRGSDNE